MSLNHNEDQYQRAIDLIYQSTLNGYEELKLLEEVKELLINEKNSGRKVIKKICGKKYKVPKKNLSKLMQVCKLVQSKEIALNSVDQKNWSEKIVLKKSKNNYNGSERKKLENLMRQLKSKESLIEESPIVSKQYQELKYHLMDSYVDYHQKCQLIEEFLKENTIAFNFLSGTRTKNNQVVEAVTDMETEDLIGYDLPKQQELDQSEPKKRKKLKFLKRIVAGISAFLMIGMSGFLLKGHESSDTVSSETLVENHTDNTMPTKKVIKSNHSKTINKKSSIKKEVKTNIKTPKKKTIVKEKKQKKINKISINNKIKLGSKFTLKKNSPIYSTANSANLKEQGKHASYSNSIVRKSAGLSIEYKKQTITFIEITSNQCKVYGLNNSVCLTKKEANREISKLLKNGGKVKSLLAQNNNGYEGYYAKSDVKVLSKR